MRKKRKIKLDQILIEKQQLTYHDETPLTGLMNSELKSLLAREYRMVFVMREIEKMSTNETMETLNLTESNAKVRLTRAKEMLRDVLSSHYKSSMAFDFHLNRCDKIVYCVMTQINTISKDLIRNTQVNLSC